MIKEIRKPSRELIVNAFQTGDFSEVDELEKIAESQATKIFEAVASQKASLVYYDMQPVTRPGYKSFMRYILHRSTRSKEALQLSCIEIRNGEEIPTSHIDLKKLDGAKEFYNRLPSCTEFNYV